MTGLSAMVVWPTSVGGRSCGYSRPSGEPGGTCTRTTRTLRMDQGRRVDPGEGVARMLNPRVRVRGGVPHSAASGDATSGPRPFEFSLDHGITGRAPAHVCLMLVVDHRWILQAMSDKELVRLLGDGVNEVIEVSLGAETVEHNGRLFQRTGFRHSVGSDKPVPSFHLVEDDE